MVKLHAEQLLDSVLKNENLTAESIGVGVRRCGAADGADLQHC